MNIKHRKKTQNKKLKIPLVFHRFTQKKHIKLLSIFEAFYSKF